MVPRDDRTQTRRCLRTVISASPKTLVGNGVSINRFNLFFFTTLSREKFVEKNKPANRR